jgi:DNA-binding response OmpR family regulator
MNIDEIRQTGETANAELQYQRSPPHRILVVEDELTIRKLNTAILVRRGYDVNAVEDGAVAWDTLQLNSHDLLITDNSMPKVRVVELIEKVRAAGMALPVVMATATMPEEEFARRLCLQPAAPLVKAYTLTEFLATVKDVLCAVPTAMLLLYLGKRYEHNRLMFFNSPHESPFRESTVDLR